MGSVRTLYPRQDEQAADAVATYVDTLFREHRTSLLRYLSGILYNPDDAAELLQETYLRLLRQDGLDRINDNAKAYLFQIATNLARDYFRQRKAQGMERHSNVDHHLMDSELQEPETSIRWDHTLTTFKKALLQLDPQVREVFLLHRFRDLTYAEIARELKIGLRTVERHMAEAVTALKRTLEWEL